jgi:hypothetical protein
MNALEVARAPSTPGANAILALCAEGGGDVDSDYLFVDERKFSL